MSRLFDGSDDVMTFPSPASAPAMNDALSLLMVVRIMTASDNTWLSMFEFNRGDPVSGGNACAFGRKPTGGSIGEMYFANTAGNVGGTTAINISDADGWMVLACTRSAAAATTFYKIPIGGSTTTFAGGALADGLTWQSTPTLTFGGPEDFSNIRVAALAYWNGTVLSQANVESVATAKTTQSILDLSPLACYDDSDAFATDLAGSADRTSVVGTADDADDPSGWVYFGVGGASQRFRWRD